MKKGIDEPKKRKKRRSQKLSINVKYLVPNKPTAINILKEENAEKKKRSQWTGDLSARRHQTCFASRDAGQTYLENNTEDENSTTKEKVGGWGGGGGVDREDELAVRRHCCDVGDPSSGREKIVTILNNLAGLRKQGGGTGNGRMVGT